MLEKAKANGAKIIAVNPLPEAGLIRFKDPQKVHGVVGHGVPIADEFAQIRLGETWRCSPGWAGCYWRPTTVHSAPWSTGSSSQRTARISTHTRRRPARTTSRRCFGSPDRGAQLDRVAQLLMASDRTVACWAMGLTQHRHAVPMISEITNLLLMRGMIGKPGAGLCPVRGHSNVQGDRTMGIWEKMPEMFLAALDARFGIVSPREHGLDTVDAIRAMRDGRAKVFMGMGGNFASATPDTAVTEAALRSCALTVQVSTKLNRSHVVHGSTALILPSLGRTDRDVQAGVKQMVSVEDSMSMVHSTRGSLQPPSDQVRSEVAVICQLARTLLGPDHPVSWERFNGDYDIIWEAIAAVVPGCADYNAKVRQADGFQLPNGLRDSREFPPAQAKPTSR